MISYRSVLDLSTAMHQPESRRFAVFRVDSMLPIGPGTFDPAEPSNLALNAIVSKDGCSNHTTLQKR